MARPHLRSGALTPLPRACRREQEPRLTPAVGSFQWSPRACRIARVFLLCIVATSRAPNTCGRPLVAGVRRLDSCRALYGYVQARFAETGLPKASHSLVQSCHRTFAVGGMASPRAPRVSTVGMACMLRNLVSCRGARGTLLCAKHPCNFRVRGVCCQ